MKYKILLICLLFPLICSCGNSKKIQAMNEKELQYDANDWFVMIDLSDKLIGVYEGTEPIEHVKLYGNLSGYTLTPIVVLWKEVKQSNVTTDLADDTPVLIYE